MDKDRLIGVAKQLVGSAKQAAGSVKDTLKR